MAAFVAYPVLNTCDDKAKTSSVCHQQCHQQKMGKKDASSDLDLVMAKRGAIFLPAICPCPVAKKVIRCQAPDGCPVMACRLADKDGHCRGRQGAECCLLSGPGGCLACRRFVSLSLPAQRMPANMRLHERPILYTDHWLMLERRRLQRLGLSKDHAQSELDTMLQRKQENRTDRNIDQRMAFDELSYTLYRQAKNTSISRVPVTNRLPTLTGTQEAIIATVGRPLIGSKHQGMTNSLSPFTTLAAKSTCGYCFSYDTNHRKYLTGIPPADLVKWHTGLDMTSLTPAG